jgi:hypothetical protein
MHVTASLVIAFIHQQQQQQQQHNNNNNNNKAPLSNSSNTHQTDSILESTSSLVVQVASLMWSGS